MNEADAISEYLVISRGKWDADASPQKIQDAIDRFYVWIEGHADAGRMRRGQRLASEGRTVSRQKPVTDGPFGETKEVIGGYWFIRAASLEEAARMAGGNPVLECGLYFELRPLELVRATAYDVTNETPGPRKG